MVRANGSGLDPRARRGRCDRHRRRAVSSVLAGLEAYRNPVIHSSEYRNPEPFAGKRVLVVGFGNSGGEIALDLANAGVDVALAVRGPVQILPRDLLGFPILAWAILYRPLPARLVDFINAPILRLALGSIEKLGLRRAAKGPRQMVEEDGRVPLIDIGTLDKIRDGSIKIRGGIDRLTPDGVVFADATQRRIRRDHPGNRLSPRPAPIGPRCGRRVRPHGMPLVTGQATNAPGLYFCGQITSPTGQLREIGLEARRIAEISKRYIAALGSVSLPVAVGRCGAELTTVGGATRAGSVRRNNSRASS